MKKRGSEAAELPAHAQSPEETTAARPPGPRLAQRPGRPARRSFETVVTVAVVLISLGIAAVGFDYLRGTTSASRLPTAEIRSGEFLEVVRCRGLLQARGSAQVVAPVNVPQLRMVWLAGAGEPVEAGRPIVRFDPSSAQKELDEKQAALEQAKATLEQAVAQARITAEQDHLDLATAGYEVERARLEVSKSEILSVMQGEEKQIELKLAEQKLRVQQATVKLHEASDQAKLSSLTRVLKQAQFDVELREDRLTRMELKAPGNGIVEYLLNTSQGWINAKPFKVGDQVWPGAAIAQIPDLDTLEMEGKLDEIDRGKVKAGAEVSVRIDSLPELRLRATLDAISPLTQRGFEWPPTRTFRGYAPIHDRDPRLRPAMNGSMDIVVKRFDNVTSVPSRAVFSRHGKPVVYLAEGDSYRRVEVAILARNPDETAIQGVPAGGAVALTEPPMEHLTP